MEKKVNSFVKDCTRCIIFSLIFSIIFILILTLIMGFVPLSDNLVLGVNQGIKALSLLFSSVLCYSGKTKGFLKGIIVGLLFSLFSWLIFCMVENSYSFGLEEIIDILLCMVMGSVCGIIAVNVKK